MHNVSINIVRKKNIYIHLSQKIYSTIESHNANQFSSTELDPSLRASRNNLEKKKPSRLLDSLQTQNAKKRRKRRKERKKGEERKTVERSSDGASLGVARGESLSACEEISRALSCKFSQAKTFERGCAATRQNSRHNCTLNEKFSSLHFGGGSTVFIVRQMRNSAKASFANDPLTILQMKEARLHHRVYHHVGACIARILKHETRNLKRVFEIRNQEFLDHFVDRKRRGEFLEEERSMMFLRWLVVSCELPGYSLSLYACALCHVWLVYAWFIVVSYGEYIRGRSSSKENDEFGSPLRDMGHRDWFLYIDIVYIYIYMYTFFFLFFPLIGNVRGNASIVIRFYRWL